MSSRLYAPGALWHSQEQILHTYIWMRPKQSLMRPLKLVQSPFLAKNTFGSINIIFQWKQNTTSRTCLTLFIPLLPGVVHVHTASFQQNIIAAQTTWPKAMVNIHPMGKLEIIQKNIFTVKQKLSWFRTIIKWYGTLVRLLKAMLRLLQALCLLKSSKQHLVKSLFAGMIPVRTIFITVWNRWWTLSLAIFKLYSVMF